MSAARTSVKAGAALRALAVLPARLASTRLERKMLLKDTGHFLFEHTARCARASGAFAKVVLATDSGEIQDAARAVGFEALLTSTEHQSGTDRVAEALRLVLAAGDGPFDVVVNVQGDEPELDGSALPALIEVFRDPAIELASLYADLELPRELADFNSSSVVKVVLDAQGDALYFSRAPIPAQTHPGSLRLETLKRHLGVYAFRPAALAHFVSLPRGILERAESLEQLRWLEAGRKIRLLRASRANAGIDTRADYDAFVARWKRSQPH